MTALLKTRTPRAIPIMLLAASLAACDASSDPMGPDLDGLDAVLPAVVVGRVSVPAPSLAAGPSMTSASDLSGVIVSANGAEASDTTDAGGTFRVESSTSNGIIVLHFRRGSLDATLQLSGVGPGVLIQVEVTLSDDSVSLSDSSQGDHNEFDGYAALVSVSGNAPERTARVEVSDTAGALLVDIVEGTTTFDNEGDVLSFADMLAALEAGRTLEMEGDGTRRQDGSVAAAHVKVETDEDDDGDNGDDDNEFEGQASFVSISGDAPSRTLRVEVADTSGTIVVDILEGVTTFDSEGDILSFEHASAALQAGTAVEIEGDGTLRDDKSVAASKVKVETEDDDDDDDGEDHDFDGDATLVSVTGDAPSRTIRVAVVDTTATVMVDLVEGATTWDNEGDLTSFGDVLAALTAGTLLEMEGEGTLQDDGSIAASKVKVEKDD